MSKCTPRPAAQTDAERARVARQRKKANSLQAVKIYLSRDELSLLHGVCDIHGLTLSQAVALAVTHLMRGEPHPSADSVIHGGGNGRFTLLVSADASSLRP
jgi:hypothetical protein